VNIQFGRKSELLLLKFHIVHTGHPYHVPTCTGRSRRG
jgi:hypothetical protein